MLTNKPEDQIWALIYDRCNEACAFALSHSCVPSHALLHSSASEVGGRRDAVRTARFGGITRHGILDPLLASAAHKDDPLAVLGFDLISSNGSSL